MSDSQPDTSDKRYAISDKSAALSRLRYYLPTLVVAVAVLLAWELIVRVFDIKQFLIPKPTSILEAFADQQSILFDKGFNWLRSVLNALSNRIDGGSANASRMLV